MQASAESGRIRTGDLTLTDPIENGSPVADPFGPLHPTRSAGEQIGAQAIAVADAAGGQITGTGPGQRQVGPILPGPAASPRKNGTTSREPIPRLPLGSGERGGPAEPSGELDRHAPGPIPDGESDFKVGSLGLQRQTLRGQGESEE